MANNHNDYEELSSLLYPSIEAAYVLFTLKIIEGSVPDATTIST